jgi:excinuclease UvrABC nuclease subunit
MKNKYVRNPEKNAINRQAFFEKLYPDIPREGVYCIYNEIEELIYVGESNNLPRRMAEHIGGYDKTKSFHKGELDSCFVKDHYTYKIIETKTLKERLIKEIELEFEYEPEYNKRWRRN